MNFFEHQDVARRKTGRLVWLFAAAVAAIILSIYFIVVGLASMDDSRRQIYDPHPLWKPEILGLTVVLVGGVILIGSLWRTATLRAGGKTVAEMLGGRLLSSSTRDLRERRLLNVVEEMALAAGMPVPPVYVMDSEEDVNAFAAGFTPADGVIGVTRGTINSLTRDELQGVIAHEFSHILNGDMRLNLRLIGILHGILLISLIGYMVMRIVGSSRPRSSGSKKDGAAGAAAAMLMLGLALYILGYIGVFFGKLIKSAVSRQREYLADASAVQFTRNPGGIGGALKKIGALGSRIQNSQAEQASHMFFGNAVGASFMQLLATHPPLVDRIRRIEPQFDGNFARERLSWPTDEDPQPQRAKPARKPGFGAFPRVPATGGVADIPGFPVGVAPALAAGAEMSNVAPLSAAGAVGDVGAPTPQHFEFAAAMLDQIPPELSEAIHYPAHAAAVIYALLLVAEPGDDEPGLRMLAESVDADTAQRTRAAIGLVAPLGPVARLPLAQLTMSALRELSPEEFERFRKVVVQLIRADRQVSLFEFCLQRVIVKHLADFFRPRPPQRVRFRSRQAVQSQAALLFSALAYAGNKADADAAAALTTGAAKFGASGLMLLPRTACGYAAIDQALNDLAQATGDVKQHVLEAAAETISHDGAITIDEGELLRTIADALDCPMPPPAAQLIAAE